MTNALTLVFTGALIISCGQRSKHPNAKSHNPISSMIAHHSESAEQFARKQVKLALSEREQGILLDTMIKTSLAAIAIAEPTLFELYGKQQILAERPYEVYLIDGYWYLSGTIPKGFEGGGFEIIFSAVDARIVKLTHYK
jgi:hypothetical protein